MFEVVVFFVEKMNFLYEVFVNVVGWDGARWFHARRERCTMKLDKEVRVCFPGMVVWFSHAVNPMHG